ncbi:RNA-guided endonuclease InsQ/TnpB family protein [Streptomyces sp. NPDC059165]|uniref:RNA-guided endonuclease InsQ/TnpB family protein n=1 Tax=Streptomyces sp. NPDC059165 TaxID=3346751 RepID=UPI00368DE4D6
MIRAYTFLLRPTESRAAAPGEMLRDHCSLYNGALQERRDAYRHASKTSITHGGRSAQLKDVRAFDPERRGRWSFSGRQATLRRLDEAFQAFFRRVKAGRTPGYPHFEGIGHFDTVTVPGDGDGCRWDSTPHDPVARVRLRGIGHIRVHRHRRVRGRSRTISVKREGNRRHTVLVCDDVPADNPGPDLETDGAFPVNGAAKAGLNRVALDAGWGVFLAILADKAESAGRTVLAVDPRNTSRTCPSCGHTAKENRAGQAQFPCTACGFTANADHVGATNVPDRAGPAFCDVA